MEFQKPLCLFLTLISISLSSSSSHAYKFNVGGQEGWVLNPTESYNHWAERNRFLINDTLYFKYKKGSDSVLLVNEDDYSNCNTRHPFLIMVSGDSEFTFDRSGPFYFISGNPDHCLNGQKLIVVVLHPIIIIPPPAAAPTTSPCPGTQQPPQVVPPSSTQAPKGSSPVPAPSAYPPKGSSSPSSPPSSQSPSANSPSPAAVATSPNASSPTTTSPTTTPSSGNAPSPPSSTNPNTPADVTPPPSSESQTSGPSKSSAGATTSGLRMLLGVSLLLGLVSSAFVGVN